MFQQLSYFILVAYLYLFIYMVFSARITKYLFILHCFIHIIYSSPIIPWINIVTDLAYSKDCLKLLFINVELMLK